MPSETRVIINLSDQRASLVKHGRIALVSPIASGKPGWSMPTGKFSIFHKISTIGLGASGRSSTLRNSGQFKCDSQRLCTQGRPLSTRADVVLHGIQPGGWDARRLPFSISRVPQMRADAARSRSPVFRAGPNWNASHGRRQHTQPDSRPQGHAAIAHRFICVGSALMEVADQGECAGPLD